MKHPDDVLPHDADAERAVLGAMLLEPGAIHEAIDALGAAGEEAFLNPRHRLAYRTIVALSQAHTGPVDGIVIKDTMIRDGVFEEVGGYDFLGELVSAVPSALRIREYARIVREKYLARLLINTCHHLTRRVYEGREPIPQLLDDAEKEITGITERRVTTDAVNAGASMMEAAEFASHADADQIMGLPTGFFELDDMLCGLQRGELIVVAGRPSMGKSAFAVNVAEHLCGAESPPMPVLFITLEMKTSALASRLLCSRCRIDSQRMRQGRLTPEELDRMTAEAEVWAKLPLFVDDISAPTITQLRARARIAQRKRGIQCVIVDYLQLASAPGRKSRQEEIAAISAGLKAIAKDLNVPVVAVAQLNRLPETRRDPRPRMSDLRESGAIEQDADVILLLHRAHYYDPKPENHGRATVIVAKQRNGPVGEVELSWDAVHTRFTNAGPRPVVAAPIGMEWAT